MIYKKFIASIASLLAIPFFTGAAVYMPVQGGTGTSTKPTIGQMLIGNSIGTYNLISSSSLFSNYPTFSYGSSTYATSGSLTNFVTYLYASSTYMPLASSSLFYLATNPAGYISSTTNALINYPTYTYASSTFASTSWVNATFQTKLTNPTTGTGTSSFLTYWTGSGTLGAMATGTAGYLLMASSTSASGLAYVATSSLGITGGSGIPSYAVTVISANGVSATAATTSTTTALTFTLGAITPTTVNNITLSGSTATIDSYSGTPNTSGNLFNGNPTTILSQSFTNTKLNILSSVSLSLYKTGSPTGNAVVKIYAHSGTYGTDSVPTGAVLATSDNFDVSTLSVSAQTVNIPFSGANKIQLQANTYYVLTISYPGGDTSNRLYISLINGGSASGNYAQYNGTWTAISTYDMTPFTVYGLASVLNVVGTTTIIGTNTGDQDLSGLMTYTYGSSTFPTYTYASSTFLTLAASTSLPYIPSASSSLYYLNTNPAGYITSTSTAFIPAASSSLYYLNTNPANYITATSTAFIPFASSSLYYLNTNPANYITATSTAFIPFASSSLYYLNTNPSGFIASSTTALTNYPTYTYASSTFLTLAASTSLPYVSNTYASSTFVPYTGATTGVNLGTNTLTVGGTSTFATTTATALWIGGTPTSTEPFYVQNYLSFPTIKSGKNIFMGEGTGAGFNINNTDQNSIFIGTQTGIASTTFDCSTFICSRGGNLVIGSGSFLGFTNSAYNLVIGDNAAAHITDGDSNTIIGNGAGTSITTSGYNILIGANAGSNGYPKGISTGYGNNIAIGVAALGNSNQASDIAIGRFAGYSAAAENELYIDGPNTYGPRSSNAEEKTASIIYGIMNTASTSQYLTLNANTTVGQTLAAQKGLTVSGGNISLTTTGGQLFLPDNVNPWNPQITFTSDNNTGFSRKAADVLSFVVSGQEGLVLAAASGTASMGIGNINPTDTKFNITNSGSHTNFMTVSKGNTETGDAFIIKRATGNVGIGTTTPNQTLSVVGNARLSGAFFDGTNASGTLGMVLVSTGNSTVWASRALTSEIFLEASPGVGSTNNAIKRFSTIIVRNGTDITYATSTANGDTFTINATGTYAISYSDAGNSGGEYFGISVNSNQLTTGIQSITQGHRRVAGTTPGGGTFGNFATTLILNTNDVVRAHYGKNSTLITANNLTSFRIVRTN